MGQVLFIVVLVFLTLGNLEAPKDPAIEKGRELSYEEKPLNNPPIEGTLTTHMICCKVHMLSPFP